MEYYLEMEELTILIHATMWMNLKVLLSEKSIYCTIKFHKILKNVKPPIVTN